MFKHVLKIITFVLIIIIVVTYFNHYLLKTHTIYISDSLVKYKLRNIDDRFLKKYSKKVKLKDLPVNSIFYTTEPWTTKNNNYMFFNDRYYIIEPGYYYLINKDAELHFNETEVFCKI
jgi:hypothetical protein